MVCLVVGLLGGACHAAVGVAQVALVPEVRSLQRKAGEFVLDAATCLKYPRELAGSAAYLRGVLAPATGFALPVGGEGGDNCVEFLVDGELEAEAYVLSVDGRGVRIVAATEAGAFYGVQSLRQLLPVEVFSDRRRELRWSVPAVLIEDRPRFAWRGMHLDVARHFMPVETIKKFLDVMAMHKMNRFHWHLANDQGWRIEIKSFPRLTEVGGCRKETVIDRKSGQNSNSGYDGKAHCGHYTQEQIRDIVAYAARLHITIIPEIPMPGHAQAAIASYPELGILDTAPEVKTEWGVGDHSLNMEESTMAFLRQVLLEIMALFPGEYIHIGGDEVRTKVWKNNPKMQRKMRQLGFSNEGQLYRWFVQQQAQFLAQHGRRMVGWDETLQEQAPHQALIMPWRGVQRGVMAAQAGYDVVMTPSYWTYFLPVYHHMPLQQIYRYDPLPAKLKGAERERILGAQGQLWTEKVTTPQQLEYNAHPRTAALAEVLWLPPKKRNYQDFLRRLETHTHRWDAQKIHYRPLSEIHPSFWQKLDAYRVAQGLKIYRRYFAD